MKIRVKKMMMTMKIVAVKYQMLQKMKINRRIFLINP